MFFLILTLGYNTILYMLWGYNYGNSINHLNKSKEKEGNL